MSKFGQKPGYDRFKKQRGCLPIYIYCSNDVGIDFRQPLFLSFTVCQNSYSKYRLAAPARTFAVC
jgi:hypothetical protein